MVSFLKLSQRSSSDPSRVPMDHAALAGRMTNRSRNRQRPMLDALESRQLLTTATEVFGGITSPEQIITGSGGKLYFLESNGSVGSFNPLAPTTTEVVSSLGPDSSAFGVDMTEGPDGASVWFTDYANGNVDTINTSSTTQPPAILTYGGLRNTGATGIAAADGFLWIAQVSSNQIARLDPTTGTIKEYTSPGHFNALKDSNITLGDGDLFFVETGYIGYFNPANPTTMSEIPLPGGASEQPLDITAGPNNTIWYTAQTTTQVGGSVQVTSVLGEINAATDTLVQEYSTGSDLVPNAVTEGGDGNIWLGNVASAPSTASGSISEFNVATHQFTTIPVSSTIESFPQPDAITAGSDGNIWFTDSKGAVGEVVLSTQLVASPTFAASENYGTSLTFQVTDEYSNGSTDTAFNGSVQVIDGSKVIATATAVNGVASFSGVVLPYLGTNSLQIVSTAASNVPQSASASVNVVKVTPPTPAAPQLSPADVTGTQANITDITKPTLTGTSEPGSTVTLYDSGVLAPFGTATVDASGNYTISLSNPATLALGGYQFSVVASNNLGTSQASPTFSLTVVAPPVTPSAPSLLPSESNGAAGGETTTATSPELVGTTEDSVTVQLLNASGTVLATTQSTSSGSYEFQVPGPLSPGSYAYRVSIIDQYGDVSAASPAATINVVGIPTPSPTSSPTPTPTPPPTPVIIGEMPIFSRKLNKKGVPVGKATLTGFELIFSQPIGGSALNAGEYTVEKIVAKATRKKPEKLSNVGFSVVSKAPNAVVVNVSNQTFPTGGLLTVNAAISSAAGAALGVTDTFLIGKGGKTISPE